MKTLQIPHLDISQCETVSEKVALTLKNGAKANIDQVNWKEDFPKFLPVSVCVAHNGEKLYLYYQVTGEEVRAENTQDFGSVWEDSCVEFFMQREGESIYRNFECNVIGALLASKRKTRDDAEKLTEFMDSISRFSTITHRYENGKQVSDWTLFLEIPKQAMGFAENETLSGEKIRANFYKCGDKTPETHFISWNPIHLPKPDFHVPQFFGLLECK